MMWQLSSIQRGIIISFYWKSLRSFWTFFLLVHIVLPNIFSICGWHTNHQQRNIPFGQNGSVRVDVLCQSGGASSELSETPRWRITLRPAWIQRIVLYITLQSLFHCLFMFCWSPILNDHSGVVANCDSTSEWVPWVRACIGIEMRWVMLRIYLLTFSLPARKMQFSLYLLYTSFQVARSRWLLTILPLFRPLPVLLLVAISGITCTQPTICRTLKTCKATAAGAFHTCTNFETGSKLPEFSGMVMTARANQYWTKAPSSFWSLILNSRWSCHGRRPFSAL